MSSAFHRKCPLCGGDLVRSQTHVSGYTTYFWKKPWKRGGLFGWGLEKVFPWACMGCGVVLLFLERLPAVAEEFRSLRSGERVSEGQPASLKP